MDDALEANDREQPRGEADDPRQREDHERQQRCNSHFRVLGADGRRTGRHLGRRSRRWIRLSGGGRVVRHLLVPLAATWPRRPNYSRAESAEERRARRQLIHAEYSQPDRNSARFFLLPQRPWSDRSDRSGATPRSRQDAGRRRTRGHSRRRKRGNCDHFGLITRVRAVRTLQIIRTNFYENYPVEFSLVLPISTTNFFDVTRKT